MLKLELEKLRELFQKSPEHNLDLKLLLDSKTELNRVKTQILSRNQGFIDLPSDIANLDLITDFTSKNRAKYTSIVLIGIGGSSLGPKCLLQALGDQNSTPVHILDNIDPDEIATVSEHLDYNGTLFLIITKSGTTPETIATYLHFKAKVAELGLLANEHFVFITDPGENYLQEIAKLEHIPVFEIPANVGGRFSVLSSVGLVLGGFLGFDLKELLAGAAAINQDFLADTKADNQIWQLAKIQFELAKLGKNMAVIMPYSSRLNSFGHWYTQLFSESLGKEFDRTGNLVNVGITPIPAVGATDQHSQLQLFKAGPNDKLVIFIQVLEFDHQIFIPKIEHPSLAYLSGQSLNNLIRSEYQATSQSLTESNRANLTITIPKVNAFYLGQLFQFFELTVACLGELYEINTFDQPEVERGKILTKQILENTAVHNPLNP